MDFASLFLAKSVYGVNAMAKVQVHVTYLCLGLSFELKKEKFYALHLISLEKRVTHVKMSSLQYCHSLQTMCQEISYHSSFSLWEKMCAKL